MQVVLTSLEKENQEIEYSLYDQNKKVLFQGQINEETREKVANIIKNTKNLLVYDLDEFTKLNENTLGLDLSGNIQIADVYSQFKYIYKASYGDPEEKLTLEDCAKYYAVSRHGIKRNSESVLRVMLECMEYIMRDIKTVNEEVSRINILQQKLHQAGINTESNIDIYSSFGCGCLLNMVIYYIFIRLLLLLMQ